MSAGTYALSLQEREALRKGNPKTVGPILLRLLGDHRQLSIYDMRSITGLPEDQLMRALDELQMGKLIEGDLKGFFLTSRGDKARYFVAS